MLYQVHLAWAGFELTTLVIGTDCIGSCKSNYHTITTMTTPILWNETTNNLDNTIYWPDKISLRNTLKDTSILKDDLSILILKCMCM
jgi:hypothetical protein